MFFVLCKACDTTNICNAASYGNIVECGNCGRRLTSRPNVELSEAVPIVCEICGSSNLRDEYVDGDFHLICEDCVCEREGV